MPALESRSTVSLENPRRSGPHASPNPSPNARMTSPTLVELTMGFAAVDHAMPFGPGTGPGDGPASPAGGTLSQPSLDGGAADDAAGTSTQSSAITSPRYPWRRKPCRWSGRATDLSPC